MEKKFKYMNNLQKDDDLTFTSSYSSSYIPGNIKYNFCKEYPDLTKTRKKIIFNSNDTYFVKLERIPSLSRNGDIFENENEHREDYINQLQSKMNKSDYCLHKLFFH